MNDKKPPALTFLLAIYLGFNALSAAADAVAFRLLQEQHGISITGFLRFYRLVGNNAHDHPYITFLVCLTLTYLFCWFELNHLALRIQKSPRFFWFWVGGLSLAFIAIKASVTFTVNNLGQ